MTRKGTSFVDFSVAFLEPKIRITIVFVQVKHITKILWRLLQGLIVFWLKKYMLKSCLHRGNSWTPRNPLLLPNCILTKGNQSPDFQHYRFVLPVFVLYIKEAIYCLFLCLTSLFNIIFVKIL